MRETINILIADDHQIVIDGLKSMLAPDVRYQIVAEANNGQEAYEMITAEPERYHFVLTDVGTPLLTGTQLCKMVKSQFPHIQVLILSMYNNALSVKEAVMAEANGYILKNTRRAELLQAMQRITSGGTYFSQDIVPGIYSEYHKQKMQDEQLSQLSIREKEVLSLILKELTSEEIAEKLFISKKTVDNHRQHLLEKINCKSAVGLVKFAIKNGLE